MLIKLLGIPVVYTAHNVLPHDLAERNAFGMLAAYDAVYSIADRIIVHGTRIKEELEERFRPERTKVSVIPHGDYAFAGGGESESSRQAARESLGLPPDSPIILAFGAIRDYKGIAELIEALPDIAQRIPNLICLVAGKPVGVDVETYRRRARKLSVDRHLLIHDGYVDFDRIHLYFEAADVAAFPYRNIAQSGALQLAYAFAKPVVATAVGALPDTIEDGVNGHLIPPNDHPALVDALTRILLMDSEKRDEMGRRSLALAQEEHSWQDAAESTVELYRTLLA